MDTNANNKIVSYIYEHWKLQPTKLVEWLKQWGCEKIVYDVMVYEPYINPIDNEYVHFWTAYSGEEMRDLYRFNSDIEDFYDTHKFRFNVTEIKLEVSTSIFIWENPSGRIGVQIGTEIMDFTLEMLESFLKEHCIFRIIKNS